MTKTESAELRIKNNCSTCARMSNMHQIGCQVFKEEPRECWAWTDDKDWLKKANKACREYRNGKVVK